MKKTVQKIRQQPLKVREAIMWFSVITVFSFIGTLWFVDFQRDSYALLNPDKVQQQDTAVAKEDSRPSPFAAIFTAIGDFKEDITGIFNSDVQNEELRNPNSLPLSE